MPSIIIFKPYLIGRDGEAYINAAGDRIQGEGQAYSVSTIKSEGFERVKQRVMQDFVSSFDTKSGNSRFPKSIPQNERGIKLQTEFYRPRRKKKKELRRL